MTLKQENQILYDPITCFMFECHPQNRTSSSTYGPYTNIQEAMMATELIQVLHANKALESIVVSEYVILGSGLGHIRDVITIKLG
jgi:hypothetical protein